MNTVRVTHPILKYLPRKKPVVKHSQNIQFSFAGHKCLKIKNKQNEIMCEIPIEQVMAFVKLSSCLSFTFNNTQMVVFTSNEKDTYRIFIYFIKTNLKKITGFDSVKTRKIYFSKKYDRLKNLINSLKFNICLYHPRSEIRPWLLFRKYPKYYAIISKSKLTQTVYYRFAIDIK